jgi:hypothetical protein
MYRGEAFWEVYIELFVIRREWGFITETLVIVKLVVELLIG